MCQGDEKSADNTSLLARALKMHRCKSVGQNRHVSLPCMPHELREVRMLSLRQNKKSVFSRTCAGKIHLKSRERGDERGGQRGRKRVKRKRLPVVVPVKIKIPVASADMRRHSDTLRGAKRRRKRGLRGENRISVSEFCCLPVSICLPVVPRKGANGGKRERERQRTGECCHPSK